MSHDDNKQSESIQPDLIDQLVAEMHNARRTQATYRLVLDLDNWSLPSLDKILGVQGDDLPFSVLHFMSGQTFLQ